MDGYLSFVIPVDARHFEKIQNQRTISSEYLSFFRIKGHWVWVFEKKQIQEGILNFGYFKKIKELPGFMKELAKFK